MTFFPKSFDDCGSASSATRYFFRISQLKIYTPIEARLLFGTFGFSSNSVILISGSVLIMPILDASDMGTVRTAIVHSAPFFRWKSSMRE